MTGEIYIADKQTLDSVKQDTTALLNKPNGVINGLNYRAVEVREAKTILTTVADVTGSGYLKTALLCSAGEGCQIIITVDGKVIYGTTLINIGPSDSDGSFRAYGIAQKITSKDYNYGRSVTTYAVEGVKDSIQISSYLFPTPSQFPSETLKNIDSTTPGTMYIIGEKIRFEKSLKVEMVKKPTSGEVVVEYYLD